MLLVLGLEDFTVQVGTGSDLPNESRYGGVRAAVKEREALVAMLVPGGRFDVSVTSVVAEPDLDDAVTHFEDR